MFDLLRKIIFLLDRKQRISLLKLQFLVVLMGVAEVCSVASIAPFMTIIGNVDALDKDGVLKSIYLFSGVSEPYYFIVLVGFFSLGVLLVSSIISMVASWYMSMYASRLGTQVGDKLYQYYLSRDWLYHVENNSAHLSKKISIETHRLTMSVLMPFVRMNSKVVLALIMGLGLFFIDPVVSMVALFLFGVAYFFLYSVVKKKLTENGENVSASNNERFVLMAEAFGGIKDVILFEKMDIFHQRFCKSSAVLAYAQGANQAIVDAPRYFMELVTFSAMILLVLYLYSAENGDVSGILALLSIYAMAGLKMLPAFQQIYRSVGMIKGNRVALDDIYDELKCFEDVRRELLNDSKLFPVSSIALHNVCFTYPGSSVSVLNNINLDIPCKKTIGIVGASGSGKSTLLDVLLGLIHPDTGCIKVDGVILGSKELSAWKASIGYVPQSIYLADKSLAENIAFGVPVEDIDYDALYDAIQLSHLNEVVESLSGGVTAHVGEHGVQLSGGQRQRIGIARALYRKPNVLVFDEATSALDGVTERYIMEALEELSGSKTIIMVAHRLKTVEKCDVIYMLNSGSVVASGSYDELLRDSEEFNKMVRA